MFAFLTIKPITAWRVRIRCNILANHTCEQRLSIYDRSAYDRMRSIQATPVEMIEILCESVGDAGTVVMPTFPREELYRLIKEGGDCQQVLFDCRRTPSYSGYLTEIFRRMPETERSLHPTHPVAARGAAAAWVTTGHERSHTPFDEHSPFHKLYRCNAMICASAASNKAQ
jgi:aminoglycoside N3'-acetyltransferase